MRKMIPPDEALALVLEAAEPLPPVRLPLDEAVGGVLTSAVRASEDQPRFDRSMMDGFAVRLADAGRAPVVSTVVAAGAVAEAAIEDGRCVEIMTGAPCPPGTEAVVKVEDTVRDGDHVQLPAAIQAHQNIARRGSECSAGTVVLSPGDLLTPLAVATAAAVGETTLAVHRRPRLAIVSTGSELVEPGQPLGPGQIRDSNGLMLSLMARELGLRDVTLTRASDTPDALAGALEAAASADIVAFSGGVSMGRYDLVPAALAALGAETVFHKVRQKPGKPLLFARRGRQLLFGLPGNPLSSHLGLHRYVAPAARVLSGRDPRTRTATGTLTAPVHVSSGRELFLLARVSPAEAPGGAVSFRVSPREGRGSADLFNNATANAYLRLPAGDHALSEGAAVGFEWLGERRWRS